MRPSTYIPKVLPFAVSAAACSQYTYRGSNSCVFVSLLGNDNIPPLLPPEITEMAQAYPFPTSYAQDIRHFDAYLPRRIILREKVKDSEEIIGTITTCNVGLVPRSKQSLFWTLGMLV